MKSLYESIISSNSARGGVGEIKAILDKDPTSKGTDELNDLWNKLGLGIQSCKWNTRNPGKGPMHYVFESPAKMLIIINRNISNGKIDDMIVSESNFDFYLTTNKKVDYKDWIERVEKKLNAKITEIKSNKYWLSLKF